jgi:integration host factor subunit alpha
MTKADIVESIQTSTGNTQKASYDLLEAALEIIKETLVSGEEVKIAGFGKFELQDKKDRNGRNPHTGEAVIVKARRVTTFKVSPILKADMNR